MAFDAERAGRAFLDQNGGDIEAALASVDDADRRFREADIDRAKQLDQTRAWIREQAGREG